MLSGTGQARTPTGWLAGLSRPRRIAAIAALVWLVVLIAYAAGFMAVASGTQTRGTLFLDAMFFLIALILPLGLIALAARLAEELQRQREIVASLSDLTAPLLNRLDATRDALDSRGPDGSGLTPEVLEAAVDQALSRSSFAAGVAARLEEVLAGQGELARRIAAVPAAMAQTAPEEERAEPAPAPAPQALPEEAFAEAAGEVAAPPAPPEPMPLLPDAEDPARPGWPDLVRALDFPRDEQDFEGFRALQAVLRYQPLAVMLQSAEDVLTLLSQEGVYMDDLAVEMGPAQDWRRFIKGARGPGVGSVGGVRDEEAMESTRSLLRSDPVFRDTALFFQRRFDRVLSQYSVEASDEELLALADTRSGRAFMLLVRLNGAFE